MASRRLRLPLAVLVAAVLGAGSAQYANAPFRDQAVVQSRAYGLELLLQRLAVIDAVPAPLDDDYLEQVESMLESDVQRFIGTLTAADPALADELLAALEEVEELAEAGEDAAEAVAAARDVVERAYDVVIPAETRSSAVFIAAVIADLSMGEGGVGEGYEEAAGGELAEFTSGWAALQRVEQLWGLVASEASDQQRQDIEEMLAVLAEVYPNPEPPAVITGSPEEAEAPVQRLIGSLETVVDAELFPGRDMVALSGQLEDAIVPACEAYDAGDDAIALEIAIAVGDLYANHLGGFIGFMAPEAHAGVAELVFALTGIEGEDEGDEEGSEAGEDAQGEVDGEDGGAEEDDEDGEDERPALGDPAAACRELIEALREAGAAFGG